LWHGELIREHEPFIRRRRQRDDEERARRDGREMQQGGEEPMAVDGGAADARKRTYSDACDGGSEDDDQALEDMALAFGAGQGGDDESSSDSGSSGSEDEDFESDGGGFGLGGRTPPRSRGADAEAPTQPRKTYPELRIPTLDQLLREKLEADLVKQRRREAAEREEAEYAAQLAETESICANIMATVTQMDDLLPPAFRRDAGTFVEPTDVSE
jgi:hypothetical protein